MINDMRTPSAVELIEVIHIVALRGKGTKESVMRQVHQYWSKDGELLAEHDSCPDEEKRVIDWD